MSLAYNHFSEFLLPKQLSYPQPADLMLEHYIVVPKESLESDVCFLWELPPRAETPGPDSSAPFFSY